MDNKQVIVNPYLTFTGNCKEALEFYKSALNGTLDLMTFEGAPVDIPDKFKGNVMHATLSFNGAAIMASDAMPGMEVPQGDNVSVSLQVDNVETGEKYFKALSEKGTVIMPWEKTFWGAQFGMFKDKFGISWMINCQLEEA